MALISENNTVFTISNMNQYSSYSIMGANIKPFNDKYCMNERNVYATWRSMCEKNEDVIRVCMQVKELVDMRDKYIYIYIGYYIGGNVVKLLNVYVQSDLFTTEHAKCIYFIFLILF